MTEIQNIIIYHLIVKALFPSPLHKNGVYESEKGGLNLDMLAKYSFKMWH